MSDQPFIGRRTVFGADGEHWTPYLTALWIGRLNLHIFHRGDADPDAHDHPWDFWTFPLTPYVEEVWHPETGLKTVRVVGAFRLHARKAEFAHRVLGAWDGSPLDDAFDWFFDSPIPVAEGRRIVTLIWKSPPRRKWGFWKDRGAWCWTPWRTYVFAGGKHAPCSADEPAAPLVKGGGA